MKILILGAKGMLGRDLYKVCLEGGHEVLGWDVEELDITRPELIKQKLPSPDVVVNCAAYTRVDDAETNREVAYKINAEAPRYLARECLERKVTLCHISTDYVFDGTANLPYPERASTSPVNLYGASKLAGEKGVRSVGGKFLIVRTQSLFGVHGHNFVKAIGRKVRQGDPFKVVNDQVMAPTYTLHLAQGLLKLLELKEEGVVHVTASGSCTWYDFAVQIALSMGVEIDIEPIQSKDLNLPAPRPAYSVLSSRKFRLLTGGVLPTWQEGLKAYMKEKGALA